MLPIGHLQAIKSDPQTIITNRRANVRLDFRYIEC